MALDTQQYVTTVEGRGGTPVTTYAPDTTLGYLNSTIQAIPGLSDIVSGGGRNWIQTLQNAMQDPVSFSENQLLTASQNNNQDQINANLQFLNQQGLSGNQIQTDVQNLNTQYQQNAASSGGFLNQLLNNPTAIAEIAAAAAIPGMAETLAPSIASALGVSSATATAIATGTLSAATQVAAGVPVDKAIQNAAISTVVSTGANDAATSLISQGNNPAAVNSITSGVAGAVQTAANGGNVSQILENAGAGAAASISGTVAQNVGASPTVSNVVGGTVGGALQAGGGAMGAAIGAITGLEKGVIPPNSVAVTLPDGSTGYMTNTGVVYNKDGTINQGSSVIPTPGAPVTGSTTQTAGFTPINVIQDTQVASTEGTPPPINLQAGLNKFANGSFYWAAQGPSGSLEAVPVVITSNGNIVSATGSASDTAFLTNSNVPLLKVDVTQIDPVFLDKTPIDPKFTPAELDALSRVQTSQPDIIDAFTNIVKNVDLQALSNSAYSENAIGALSNPVIQNIINTAANGSYLNEILQNLSNPDLVPQQKEYYKGLLSELVAQYPQLSTQEISNLINPPLVPIEKFSTGYPGSSFVAHVEAAGLPENVPSDAVASIDSNGNLVFFSPSANQAYTTKGEVATETSTKEATDTTTQTPVTTAPDTPSKTKTDVNIYPGSVLQPKQTTDTTLQPATQTTNALPQNLTPSSPGYGYSPASFNAPEVSAPSAPGKTLTPGSTTLAAQETSVGTKSEGSYGSTSAAPYDPNLFIYGNAPKGLGTIPQVLPLNQPITGQTQGTSGVAGQVSVESPEPQKAVWNTQSLKLKSDAEQPGNSNYDNLSTALGI